MLYIIISAKVATETQRSAPLHDTDKPHHNNYTSLLLQLVTKDLTIHQSIIPFSIGKMQPQNIIIELYKLCLN